MTPLRYAPKTTPLAPITVAHWVVGEDSAHQRIDNFLIKFAKGVPKSHIYRILRSGEVRVNKKRVDPTYRLQLEDVIRIPPLRTSNQEPRHHIPEAVFPVLYEDDDLLAIDKPAGIAVHGGSGLSYGIIEQLRHSRPESKFLELVHRLDRETSGILLLAKKRSALVAVHAQLRTGTMDKRYLACVKGKWSNSQQHLKFPLFKYHTADGERRVRVQEDGQAAHTIITKLDNNDEFSLLEARLKTGRTHQIRVHLAHAGYPILGDDKYGDFALNRLLTKAQPSLRRMFLHACKLELQHPRHHHPLILHAPLPSECQTFINQLNKQKHALSPI